MAISPSSVEQRSDITATWRDLQNRHAQVTCALDKALQPIGIGLSDFDVLERLTEGAPASVRMNDLAKDLYLSQSALSRVVARLERKELAVRHMCPEDRRGVFVALTDDGRATYAKALPVHREVLSRTWHECDEGRRNNDCPL